MSQYLMTENAEAPVTKYMINGIMKVTKSSQARTFFPVIDL